MGLDALLDLIAELPPEEAEAALRAALDAQTAQQLIYSWEAWARPEQLEPPGTWRWWLLMTGRRWGKTRTAAEWIRKRAEHGIAKRIALIAQDPLAARKVMVGDMPGEQGPSSLCVIAPPDMRPVYMPSTKTLTWPNGVVASVFSAEDPDQIRGGEFDTVWIDEVAALKNLQAVLDNCEYAMTAMDAKGGPARGVMSTTPRPLKILKALVADKANVHVTRGSLVDNAANLDRAAVDKLVTKYNGTRVGRQELDGEILVDVEGALWKQDDIDELRRKVAPELVHVVIAVDPSASSNPVTSAECGIIACGRGTDGHAYILDDRSAVLTPKGWGQRVVDAFWEYEANEVVAEANNGGEMVSTIIKDIDARVPVRLVRAGRGKRTRAEPVSQMSENEKHVSPHPGRVHHVGVFTALEDQQTQWTGVATGEQSPDRMDAMVWGVWALLLDEDAYVDFV